MKKSLLSILSAVALLFFTGALGNWLGVFEGMDSYVSLITLDGSKIVKLLFAIAIVVLIENIIFLVLKAVQNMSARMRTLSTVIASMTRYGAILIIFCWCMTIIGVDVSTIFASVGIVALIIGFGAESLVADLVTGVFILFENQFNVGDIIEIGGFRGTVKSIGIRTTLLEDAGKNVKIINNADLKNVINRSNQRSVAVSEICVSYETDLDKLEKDLPKMLEQIKNENADIFVDRVEYIGVETLADSCIKLKFIADVEEENIFTGKRLLNRCLKQAFDRENIAIPFPQLDVHMK